MVIYSCRVCNTYGMWFSGYVLYAVHIVYSVRVNIMCDVGVSNLMGISVV